MEMEDHNLHHFQQQQQYGMSELRDLMNATRSSPSFQDLELGPAQPTADLFSTHRNLSLSPTIHRHQHQQHLEMLMFGRQVADIMPLGLHNFASVSSMVPTTAAAAVAADPSITAPVLIPRTSASSPSFSGFDTVSCLGGDAYSGRWPRQETLILLEIRSRLDPKFKEANQKGPLWDEVSRIMSDEHGYQRSGKKCREKFENLYKYYKKTKEGKAGRQDGKHYRFFRQLDAIYGGSSNNMTPAPESNFIGSSFLLQGSTSSVAPSQGNQDNFESTIKHSHSLSLTNSTDFDTSSSDMNELSNEALMEHDSSDKRRNRKSSGRGWQAKIRYFIDWQMKKLMERQEAWLERLMNTVEEKEKERILKQEEWRKQEEARLEREHKFQARERAWIKSKDAALVEAIQKLSGQERSTLLSPHVDLMTGEIQNQISENQNGDTSEVHNSNAISVAESWLESEVARFMQLRYEMEYEFQQSGRSEDSDLWEEVALKMACSGYEQRSGSIYKDKWDSIQMYTRNNKEWKENKNCCYVENIGQPFLYSQNNVYCEMKKGQEQERAQFCSDEGGSHSNSNAGNAVSDSCFRLVMTDVERACGKNIR